MELQNIEVIKGCFSRGLNLKVTLNQYVTASNWKQILTIFQELTQLFFYESPQSKEGFFRFVFHQHIIVSGILNTNYINLQFTLYEFEKTKKELEKVFNNFSILLNRSLELYKEQLQL